jgi:ELWxxDGT repeat protein
MTLSKLWRYGLLVLGVAYGAAVGCGPLREGEPSAGLSSRSAGLDNQCSPPTLVAEVIPGPAGGFPDGGMLWGNGSLVQSKRQLYFVASDSTAGAELWAIDGPDAGPRLVKDVLPGPEGSMERTEPRLMTAAPGGGVYFSAVTGSGAELWRSDGTAAGTVQVSDLQPGSGGSTPRELTVAGGQLFFAANDGVRGLEPWRLSGPGASPVLLRDINDGPSGSAVSHLTALGNTVFFSANDAVHGQELWKAEATDGGPGGGAVLVKDLSPMDSTPEELISFGGRLYFNADEGLPSGRELWTSDGTAGGTQLVKDIWYKLADSSPSELGVAGSRLFFTADDGVRGRELWTSDGTAGGTRMVKELYAGANIEGPKGLVTSGSRVFFQRRQEDGGSDELWTSDGTDAGTLPLKRFRPMAAGQEGEELPSDRKGVGGTLYFAANDGASGIELWKSDGTPEGTVQVMDIAPGAAGSRPRGFTRVGLKLYFVAWDPTHGDELWSMDLCDRSPPVVTCPPDFAFEADAGTGVAVPFSATAVDDITEELELEYSHAPGSLFPLGVTPVTVSAQDEVGNTGNCTFQVTVRDSVPPRVTCPQNIIVEATGTEPVAVPYPNVQAVDAVSPVTIEFDPPPGTLFTPGESTPVVLTVKDSSGNTRTCRFGVTVELPGDGSGPGGGDEDSGCSCKSLPGGTSAWGALLVLLALARREVRQKRPSSPV